MRITWIFGGITSIRSALSSPMPLPLDGGRVVLAPADAAGMQAALATALRSGEPGSGIAVAVADAPAPRRADGGGGVVARGALRDGAHGEPRSRGGRRGPPVPGAPVAGGGAPGHITLEELAALLCWQPARLLGLPAKGRLRPGCGVFCRRPST